jgi:hypothetical protein
MPQLFESLRLKLLAQGRTLYQTDYAEPGTEACLNGTQARSLYRGVDVNGTETAFLGPMCFTKLPPVPPPLPPPPPPVAFALHLATSEAGDHVLGGEWCLVGEAQLKKPITLSSSCAGVTPKQWSLIAQDARSLTAEEATLEVEGRAAAGISATAPRNEATSRWLTWGDTPPFYAKVNEGVRGSACQAGQVYMNPDEGSVAHQGFSVVAVAMGQGGGDGGAVQLASSLCSGLCLDVKVQEGSVARLSPCQHAVAFRQVKVF